MVRAKSGRKNIKTFLIIATMEVGPEDTFASMFLNPSRPKIPDRMEFCDVIELDKPVIIAPKGFKSLEVIPVDKEIVIHGINIKRVMKP